MTKKDLNTIDAKKNIIIKNAHIHNLKNIDVVIPRNKMVVITGLSGSGKSSLAFDTLYAEGQRRYVESLSSYARQFLGRINKPKVEYIKGISPAIAIEQKVNTSNVRSTVGTSTEIYDYLKLLFARIGKTQSPISNREVKKHTVSDVIEEVKTFEEGEKWLLLSPIIINQKRTTEQQLKIAQQQGFARILYKNKMIRLDEFLISLPKEIDMECLFLIVDRLIIKHNEDFYYRLADALQIAFYEGKGQIYLQKVKAEEKLSFNNKFELDGLSFIEPSPLLFSFNNPYGACPKCNGYGNIMGIDENLVFPNTSLSVYENAIFPWRGETMKWFKEQLINNASKFDFPIHRPIYQLTADEKMLIWTGNKYFEGLNSFFAELESKNYKIQNRVLLSRYRGKALCTDCNGKRLRKEANYIKICGKSIQDIIDYPIHKLIDFFKELKLSTYDQKTSHRLLIEINQRLLFLQKVGLEYLTLNRSSATLSGGESQRINLATSLGSALVGSMYILDEPSIGLHPKDSEKLIEVLLDLKKLGNTVIVVEHDEDVMKAADQIIDIGPEAGVLGGELVAQGTFEELIKTQTLTAQYLNKTKQIKVPVKRRKPKNFIEITGARPNNLKNINIKIPLDCLTVITGVSGSGKSTLVKDIVMPIMESYINNNFKHKGKYNDVKGSFEHIKHLEFVNQNPIGKSSRSNPISYIKAYDEIRHLYAKQSLAISRNFQPKHFSFNVDGGRCEVCKGDGEIKVEMQFMADVHLECEACKGKRFKKEVLDVKFNELTIFDVLNLTVDEAVLFFNTHAQDKIANKIKPLQEVGLGYIKLGQSSATLSGGEAQRVKLATFLGKGNHKDKILFIFDEPTTGLHFHDVQKLLISIQKLIENGHSVLIIEHNIDLIKCADYILDMGPNGGDKGGELVAFGTPEEVVKNKHSITGKYLKEKL